MYELSLGEFNISTFKDPEQKESFTGAMCYILFVLATFLIMIVFLNMLIAIMSDTFANNMLEREINSQNEKIRIMDEVIPLISYDKKEEVQKEKVEKEEG